MSIEHIEVLVEEPSMEAALKVLLPKILTTTSFRIHTYQGKHDLLNELPSRLKGYSKFLPDSWRIFVLVDRDDDDCIKLKKRMATITSEAGLSTKSTSLHNNFSVVNRIVIEELEAWYFGDWEAVRSAFPRVSANIPSKKNYRACDEILGGTWEAFERVMKNAGYFKSGLRKIEAAREIGKHVDPVRNSSPSFKTFYSALQEVIS